MRKTEALSRVACGLEFGGYVQVRRVKELRI